MTSYVLRLREWLNLTYGSPGAAVEAMRKAFLALANSQNSEAPKS